jgi:peptidoglycan hydrolase CwlO-like protein
VEELDLKKKLVAIALAGTILATSIVTPFTAQADEILTKIQQQETKISELDSKQSTVEETLSVITAEVDAAEKRAETLLAKPRKGRKMKLLLCKKILPELQVVIAQREEQLDETSKICSSETVQTKNYLNFIVASESFTDFSIPASMLFQKMVSANKELVEQQNCGSKKLLKDKKK